jgi:hypothetical protein
MVRYLYGLVFLGDSGLRVEDIFRLLAVFAIAYRNRIRANVVIGKDIAYTINNNTFKFDYMLYEIKKIPIDIKTLIGGERPIAIVEDSTAFKRLQERQKEIGDLLAKHGILAYYMHVTASQEREKENIILKLVEKNPEWYVLEI